MPNADAIRWFKSQFHEQIEAAVTGTPLTLDLLTAIACQETGFVWNVLRKRLDTTAEVLALCVGDTLDADRGRRAFPRTRAELVARPNGPQMFDIARRALVDMARFIPGFNGAAANPNKFCHGFGIFQHDLQFFLVDPQYFLQSRWADFDASLGKAVGELESKRKKIGLGARTTLTDFEMAAVAIAYNTGRFTPSKGLKQGFFDGSRFYGEAVFDFIRLSKTVPVDGVVAALLPPPAPGTAPLPPPAAVTATGAFFRVDVGTRLNVRREPVIPSGDGLANVIARLPAGQVVRAVTGIRENGFLEVETSLNGALIRGFASANFLEPAPGVAAVPVVAVASKPPAKGITAVFMPKKSTTVTKRTELANAHSLNESGQPGRRGATAEERRADLAAIIDWLAVDSASHRRYQPRSDLTFCNIYAHDYCHLAGCYLPRVWWSGAAIGALAQGKVVEPLIGRTIDEQRANDLFRWLRDFGADFGWRQAATPTELQTEVNQGAVGLIVARRVAEGKSGHIVAVVPETVEHRASRSTAGAVTRPLQSQAGVRNFRYGTGTLNWWTEARFAEFAFWLHA